MSEPSLAIRIAARLFEQDAATQGLGIELLDVTETSSKLAMTVRADMLNGLNLCHGGIIFTLADSAFGFACNADNHQTVSLACQISFAQPAKLGDRLTAIAHEVVRGGKTGVFDCVVTNQDERIVATFRGNSYRTGGLIVNEP